MSIPQHLSTRTTPFMLHLPTILGPEAPWGCAGWRGLNSIQAILRHESNERCKEAGLENVECVAEKGSFFCYALTTPYASILAGSG